MPTLEDAFYALTPVKQKRTKPMEVLALGLSRSGTDSLRNALEILGYSHVWHGYELFENQPAMEQLTKLLRKKRKRHIGLWTRLDHAVRTMDFSEVFVQSYFWGYGGLEGNGDCEITREDFDELLGHCDALTDAPGYLLAMELMAAYPEAKVILNTRNNENDWFRSSMVAFRPTHDGFGAWYWIKSWFSGEKYWTACCWDEMFNRWYQGSMAGNAKWVRREYHAMIRGAVEKEKLLEWSVQESWGPLCEFLGKEVPEVEFPSGNVPSDLLVRAAAPTELNDRKAKQNMAITVGIFVAVVAVAAFGNAAS